MTDEDGDSVIDRFLDSRRGILKKGAVGAGTAALGFGGASTVYGQETTDDTAQSGGGEALLFVNEFYANGQIRIISPVIEQTPTLSGVPEQAWQNYNMRVGEYLVSGEEVLLFPAQDADVQEGEVYSVGQEFTPFEEGAQEGLVTVQLEPVATDDLYVIVDGADDQQTSDGTPANVTDQQANQTATPAMQTGDDDALLAEGSDYELAEGGGKALVQSSNFRAGALFQVTSDVIEWTPRADVEGSGIFSEYNTRMANYLGTNEEFHFYPAHSATVERGGVYIMRGEFDITSPEGNLVTVTFVGTDEDTLDSDLFDSDLF